MVINSVTAKILKLYPDTEGCYIYLKNPAVQPKNRAFQLKLTHPNYKSLYALALVALTNNYDLEVRVAAPAIDPNVDSQPVEYLTITNPF